MRIMRGERTCVALRNPFFWDDLLVRHRHLFTWPCPCGDRKPNLRPTPSSRALIPFGRSLSWMRRQRAGCEVLLLPGTSPRQVNHSGSRAPPNRNRLGGRWLLDPTWDVQCRGQSPRRFCDYSRVQCACVLLASSQCLLLLYLPLHDLQTKYRDATERPAAASGRLTGLASVYFGAAPV